MAFKLYFIIVSNYVKTPCYSFFPTEKKMEGVFVWIAGQ